MKNPRNFLQYLMKNTRHTPQSLAKEMGIFTADLNAFLSGEYDMTIDIATRLERVFPQYTVNQWISDIPIDTNGIKATAFYLNGSLHTN